jgi:hypothetical protein
MGIVVKTTTLGRMSEWKVERRVFRLVSLVAVDSSLLLKGEE